jgi:hypothetical protein
MKKEVKQETVAFLVVIGLLTILNTIWQELEIIFYGEIRGNIVDTIIIIILMPFMFKGVRAWLRGMWKLEGGAEK